MFASFQVSSVCPSHSRALGAFQGAASGTSPAISFKAPRATAMSAIAGVSAGGIAPV